MTLAAIQAETWFATLILFQTGSIPIWVPLVIILLVILLFWWGLTRSKIPNETGDTAQAHESAEEEADIVEASSDASSEIEQAATVHEPVDLPEPDDLKQIEGIGPKIDGILADAGITTFDQLASTDTAALDKIVRDDAGIKIANTVSWPKQAALAADGDWDGLAELQDKLVAGRHQE